MQQVSKYILSIGAGIGGISILYFLCLVAHIPFIACLLITGTSLFFLARWFTKKGFEQAIPIGRFTFFILVAGVFIITNKVYYIGEKHGGWDAWAIWNLHAKYLADPIYWRNLFLNKQFAHPDYPLAIPASIAFFSRLAGGYHELVSFGLHFLVTLCIPILIFFEIRPKSIFIAVKDNMIFAFFLIDFGLN